MIGEFGGHKYHFVDTKDLPVLVKEIFSDNYHVLQKKIDFKEGDVILDLGANEGLFSIMMKKTYPQTRVISVEPVLRTYKTLVENIHLNGAEITTLNVGIGKKHGKSFLNVSKDYSGGSTSLCEYNPEHHDKTEVDIVTLDDLFEMEKIDRCRLMKCDIEGAEYEALYASTVLKKVDYFTAEFHYNHRLDFMGRRMDALVTWVANQTEFIHVDLCQMAE
jgi:FkbM family methyltransferase